MTTATTTAARLRTAAAAMTKHIEAKHESANAMFGETAYSGGKLTMIMSAGPFLSSVFPVQSSLAKPDGKVLS